MAYQINPGPRNHWARRWQTRLNKAARWLMSARGYSTESPEHSAKSPGGRVTCPRCKAVVSTPGSFIAGASCCEKCGYSLRRRSDKSYLLVVSIVLIIVSVIALIVLLQPVIE